ncbi:hypothetical protein CEXT_661021 [Caerostris extrusa]|uniref:Uncharacterized protein n=1 Tax=Caerostris extrusa TaxID=172846 RepID=A0AAV4NG26_CAEEX|nr:hypothetical protein CEXT_661021 [Caerostris extrusa]
MTAAGDIPLWQLHFLPMAGHKKAEERRRNSNCCSVHTAVYFREKRGAGYCTPSEKVPSQGVGYLTPRRGKTSENIRIGHRAAAHKAVKTPVVLTRRVSVQLVGKQFVQRPQSIFLRLNRRKV